MKPTPLRCPQCRQTDYVFAYPTAFAQVDGNGQIFDIDLTELEINDDTETVCPICDFFGRFDDFVATHENSPNQETAG